jgi:hypothetical protein
MSSEKKRITRKDDDSSKVIPFRDPLENLHQTINLLKLPDEVTIIQKSLEDLHSKYDKMLTFMEKIAENVENAQEYISFERACLYLGICPNTFDKYRYKTKVKIKGYKLDGIIKYKKSDLDLFMLTYDAKSRGLA